MNNKRAAKYDNSGKMKTDWDNYEAMNNFSNFMKCKHMRRQDMQSESNLGFRHQSVDICILIKRIHLIPKNCNSLWTADCLPF